MNNPNLITEDKSLLSVLEELSPFLESIKESIGTIARLEAKINYVVDLYRDESASDESIDLMAEDVQSLKLAQARVSEVKGTIDYLIDSFSGFPDTLLLEDLEEIEEDDEFPRYPCRQDEPDPIYDVYGNLLNEHEYY